MSRELNKLRTKIWRTPRSAAKVALLEEAVRLADVENDFPEAYELRGELIEEATFTGFPEKVLVAFSWALAQVDRDPQQFSEVELLWQYKWAVSKLAHFPHISLGQIEATLDDLARRLKRNGASERPVLKLRCTIAVNLGDRETLAKLLPAWKKSRRDSHSDCRACDQHDLVNSHVFLGQDRRSLQLAQPILRESMGCAEIPHLTYSAILMPLVRLGRMEDAAEYHRRGLALVKGDGNFVAQHAEHLQYLTVMQEFTPAVKVWEQHLRLALECTSPLDRYLSWQAALFLFQSLLAAPTKKRKFRVPEKFPLYEKSGTYDLQELAGWFRAEALALARQFDARVENSFRQAELEGFDELQQLSAKLARGRSEP